MVRYKKPAKHLSFRFRFLRLTSFEQVELRKLKRQLVILQAMLIYVASTPENRFPMSELEGLRDVIVLKCHSLTIEPPR